MCGIYGELRATRDPARDRVFRERADAALRHRGPDGAGFLEDGPCLLGHRRLAIIDLDERAAQPMKSHDGQLCLSFNGEIYNYLELRKETESPSGGWKTESDTEVLLQLWRGAGLAGVEKLVGMFAFAAWDAGSQRLWLVRDRLGKKPLYWAMTRKGNLRFSSEVPALLVDDQVARETTADRLAEFLQHGFISAPRTGFSSVHQVPPGCALEAWLDGGAVRTRISRYWSLPEGSECRDRNSWQEQFRATLEDAVRIRLRTDVPLGAFLSGGVDSSVISLIASRHLKEPLRTYTADFEDSTFSEGKWAREVADHINTVHTELLVAPGRVDLPRKVVAVYGDLHGDTSDIPTMAITAEMRRHVTVAISGDGGDELLGGYARYRIALDAHRRYRPLSPAASRALQFLAGRVPTWLRGGAHLARMQRELSGSYPTEFKAYPTRNSPPVLRARSGFPDPLVRSMVRHASRQPLLQIMCCDIENYLPEDNLAKVDRAGMAVGLEVRSPLIDHRLFELVMAAQPEWLVDAEGAKRPLRELYAQQLPVPVFRRPKMGFAPPITSWVQDLSPDDILSKLQGCGLAALFDRAELKRQLTTYSKGIHGHVARIWYLLIAIEWWNLWQPTLRGDI